MIRKVNSSDPPARFWKKPGKLERGVGVGWGELFTYYDNVSWETSSDLEVNHEVSEFLLFPGTMISAGDTR